MALTRESVMSALKAVQDPELFKDIVTLGIVKEVRVAGTHVAVILSSAMVTPSSKERLFADVRKATLATGAATIDITSDAPAGPAAAPAKRTLLPQIKNIIAVAAGKGGVGKSTVATNIAVGLARTGCAVGLMDGDIYGPSMPTLLGIKGKVPQVHDNKILPHAVHGIHAITIGSLVEDEKPLIWRGPMAHGAFKQLLTDNTEWPELEYLIVDLPPGTGDVPLTLCQLLPLTGAVIVATAALR